MAKMLQWECDGGIPITMSINALKYIETYYKCIEIYYKYIEIHHKYIISTFKGTMNTFKYIQIYSNTFTYTMNTIFQGLIWYFGAKLLLFLEYFLLANAMFCKHSPRFSFSPYNFLF
jgi:hypothetical protein